jgi:hypothetical protein
MGTVFYVSNEGVVPVYDLDVSCGIDDVSGGAPGGMSGFSIGTRESRAAKLSPGHKITAPCDTIKINSPDARAVLTILVDYKAPLGWWHKTETFPLKAEKAEDGTWIWRTTPQ